MDGIHPQATATPARVFPLALAGAVALLLFGWFAPKWLVSLATLALEIGRAHV